MLKICEMAYGFIFLGQAIAHITGYNYSKSFLVVAIDNREVSLKTNFSSSFYSDGDSVR